MKKEEIRKEFFRLRIKRHSFNQCKIIIKAKFEHEVSVRTLKRWSKRHNETDWDFRDKSRRPKKIYYQITPEIEKAIIELRKKTGFGDRKITEFIDVGQVAPGQGNLRPDSPAVAGAIGHRLLAI